MKVLLLYFLIVNSLTFLIAGYDKYLAIKNKRRISENTLFTVALIGGSVGLLLAMILFRHKTSKTSFIVKFLIIILLQILALFLKLTNKI
ncbi:DUF1294 domain-containing protein [Flavobacterium sp. Fl-318]|uniref:DUF1294 domain-containing protein n=1 Tax=Flavobacterium cupriresistens TaxID=2893885 RepID=A0ABU4RD03_9FLAO|nr:MULTISPECIES: DUF1294 domain-containing protein [unclassified Flavobacterium]MDX6190452.1 DUF1294 domain-containing protein [Flavobacterium sp. Fl-318]UFH43515.1 DUF1294 domain-containing protein [Flavobacterium sp. F-323]